MKQNQGKPFLKWAGGKGQLLLTFEELLPAGLSQMKDLTYIEPFVGGGAMFFYMMRNFPNVRKAVINDINPELMNAFCFINNHIR